MNVKFYFLSLVAAILAVSCVDSDYDLANVNSDNIVIGSDESVFTVPIATIIISKDDFDSYLASSTDKELEMVTRSISSDMSFTEMLDLVNAFLPSGEEVDIDKLTSDTTSEDYTAYLTDILVDELQSDETKQEEFAQALIDNQDSLNDDIYEELGISKGDDLSLDEVTSALTETLENEEKTESLKSSISTTVTDNVVEELVANKETSIDQTIDPFDLDADIVDILTGNGRIEIIATYEHDFPFTFDLENLKLSSSYDNIEFPVTAAQVEDEDPQEIDLNSLCDILSQGADLVSKITLKTYSATGSTGSELKIKLVVKKYGGLDI